MLKNPDAILIVLNQSGQIIQLNQTAERLTGLTSANSKSHFFWDHLNDEKEISQIKKIFQHTKDLKSQTEFVLKFSSEKLESLKISCTFTPIIEDQKYSNYIICTGTPYSEKSQSDSHTIQSRLKKIKKLEAVGLMTGGIAHDFNNVLTGIIGLTELSLRRLESDHPVTKYLRTVLEKSDSAASLVRKLMYFSKETIYKQSRTDLNSIINGTVNFVKRYIGEDIIFELQLAEDLENIYADPTAIEQIITNLIINARDAMPDGGSIIIKTQNISSDEISFKDNNIYKDHFYVKLSFTDSGIGMADDVRQKMFEPFFTTKGSERGTGLGLATVNEIVNEHQGFIECSSIIGEGTTFNIYFPSVSKSLEKNSKRPLKQKLEGNETLLVVEDDEDLLKGFQLSLQNFGYKVFIAKNGVEAMDIFFRNMESINMIISDVVLPEMGGMDLFLLFQKEHPKLHFLLISGYNDKIESGVNYLQKPFHTHELAGKIREILDAPLNEKVNK